MSTIAAAPAEPTFEPGSVSKVSARTLRRPLSWLALAAVVGVALFTHLGGLDLIEFKADEAMVASLALSAAHGHWPAASIATSNGGLDNPPLPLYLFALAGLVTRDPAWMAGVSAILDVLAIVLTFAIGRRHFGFRTGLAAAACYAAAAYPAMFARKLAGPYLQPFFAVLLLGFVLEASKRKRSWCWAGAVLALGALVQIHLGALLLAPALAVLVGLDAWGRRSWRPLLAAAVGGAGVIAGFGPYLIFEASHRGDFLAMVAGYVQGTPAWTGEAFRYVWTTITSPGYGDLTGAASSQLNVQIGPAGHLTPLVGLAALGGLAVAAARWRDSRFSSLLVIVLVPLLLTLHHGSGLQIHYFAFLLPSAFLLAGIGIDRLLRSLPRLAAPVFVLIGVLLLVQVRDFSLFTSFLGQHALMDSYGLPLAYQQRLFGQASALAEGNPVVAAGPTRDEQEAARYLAPGSLTVDPAEGLVLPNGGGVLAAFNRQQPALQALEVGVKPAATEPLPGGGEAAVYQLPASGIAGLASALGLQPVPEGEWTNGVQLLGEAAPRSLPGQLVAGWRITAAVDPSTMLFTQLVDDAGRQWFDHDGLPLPPADWRVGDELLTVTPAALPPDATRQEYWWNAGMYVEGGRRVPLKAGGSQLRLGRSKGGAPPAPAAGLQPSDAVFGAAIQLEGYAVAADSVTLEWRCLAPVAGDLTVFVHALDASGQVVAQADAQPAHYPTSLWDPGETVPDRHAIAVPPGATVEVGLYDLATGQRLRLADGADHVLLRA